MNRNNAFSGFPKETIRFLRELKQNNNREWFEKNRDRYEQYYLEPASDFMVLLGSELQKLSPGIQFDNRTNGRGSILRIYRDVRFSKDKSPYNASLRILFWEGSGKKMKNPGFMLRVAPEEINLYAGMYRFPKPYLENYRSAVLDNRKGLELAELINQLQVMEYTINGEMYKRVPWGYDPDQKHAGLLRYKGLYAQAPEIAMETLHEPHFSDLFLEHCRQMQLLHSWLVRAGSD
jgi:uncharacterized protein (TIGR02453 family)